MSPYYYANSTAPCFGERPMNHATPKPQMSPADFETAPGSPTNLDAQYTQGYLKSQIGKRVKITFLIGTNLIQDRVGILTNVGISFVIIKEVETNTPLLCDIYSIKFVAIYP